MLHLILGPAGSGKTTRLYEELEHWVQGGKKAILLVPEQYSFESEKALYRRLGPTGAARVEVLSFTRLCDRIFREYGGLAVNALTDTGKAMLMSLALGEVRDTLQIYARQVGSAAFVESLCAAVSEFKNGGVSPEELAAAARESGDAQLREKAAELSTIYEVYNALLESRYTDTADDLQRACRLVEDHPFFAGYGVFVDSFMTFMASEFRMLELAIGGAPHCTCAFCCDGMADQEGGNGVFSTAKKAIARLIRAARQSGVGVAVPEVLEGSHRFQNEELSCLERSFLRPRVIPCPGTSQWVQVAAAPSPWEEIQWVAANIAGLVREEGYRYSDVAVICRSLERYRTPVERIFTRYDIPCFFDRRVELESKPLTALLLSALEAVRGNYSTEAILRFAKNPALGLSAPELARLENYCYIWGVEGRHWLTPFENHPGGLSEAFDEAAVLQLEELNLLRARVIQPLKNLKGQLAQGDGISFAAGLFTLLEEVEAPRHLEDFAASLPPEEAALFLEEQSALWDALVDILDQFAQIVGEAGMSQQRLTDLLRLAIGKTDIGQRPQTLDQVMVGMADRIRPGEPRATFVIGAVEGEFPAVVNAGGVFDRPGANPPSGGGGGARPKHRGKIGLRKILRLFCGHHPTGAAVHQLPQRRWKRRRPGAVGDPLSGGENPGVSPEPRCRRPHQGGGQPSVSEGGVLLGLPPGQPPAGISPGVFGGEGRGTPGPDGSGPKPGWICHPEPGSRPAAVRQADASLPLPGGAVLRLPLWVFLRQRPSHPAPAQGGILPPGVWLGDPLFAGADGLPLWGGRASPS